MKLGTKFLAKGSTLVALRVNQSQHDDIWKRIWGFPVPNKVRISCGVLVEKRSLSSEVYGRKKKSSLMMFASTVIYPLRLFAMLYGSVWTSQKFGKLYQVLSFVSCITCHGSGTWFFSYKRKVRIWSCWQWCCGQYGTEGINLELVQRIFPSPSLASSLRYQAI